MGGKLFITILLAICLHLSVALAFFYKEPKNEGAIDKGKDGIVVGVGITGSFSNTEKAAEKEVEVVEQKKTIEKPKTQPKPEPKQEVKPKPKPKQEVKPKPEPKKEIKPKPKPKTESKVEPKPELKEELESKVESLSTSNVESKVSSNLDSDVSKKAQSARSATGEGDQVSTGGDPAVKQGYLSIVKTRISRAKKYPKSARKEGVVGTAVVRFIIKLNGKVENIKLIKSSGDDRLDQEAMNMLKKASPFPPVPSDVSKVELDLTLPIEFTLKTIKNKFY